MKRIFFFLLFLLSLLSCKKQESVKSTPGVTGEVDGTFIAFNESAAYIEFGKILIVATTSVGDKLSITLNYDTAGTYLLDYPAAGAGSHVDYTPSSTQYPTSTIAGGQKGYVVITSIDAVNKTISGHVKVTIWNGQDISVRAVFVEVPYTNRIQSDLHTNCFLRAKGEGSDLIGSNITINTSNPSRLTFTATSDIVFATTLSMPADITPGTYDIELTGDTSAVYVPLPFGPPRPNLSGHSGQLTIDQHDQVNNIIEGSFYYTTTLSALGSDNNFYVTDGRFYIEY